MNRALVITARWLLAGDDEWIEGGGLLCVGGRIERVLRTPAAVRRARRLAATRVEDLEDPGRDDSPRRRGRQGGRVLTAGFVNAHTHLELSGLRGLVEPGPDFAAWIRRLIELRARRSLEVLASDALAGAWRCVQTGTTAVGDIDTAGGSLLGLSKPPLRVRLYLEVLDAGDPGRTEANVRRIRQRLPRAILRQIGLAPHAPFTVSGALLRDVAEHSRARALPVTIHWSETKAEIEWLLQGKGPLALLLRRSPRTGGLDLIERAGLLAANLSLVHGNHPARGEPERIARAGSVVVHCPGSHSFFRRPRFDLERYSRAGVRLALGTDSLASNSDLDLRREMRLLREAHPELDPREVWDMATRAGARALGWHGQVGELSPGAWADLVAHSCASRKPKGLLEELTQGQSEVRGVWIAGKSIGRAQETGFDPSGRSPGNPRSHGRHAEASHGEREGPRSATVQARRSQGIVSRS